MILRGQAEEGGKHLRKGSTEMENGSGKDQGNSRNNFSEVEVLTTRDVARIMKCGEGSGPRTRSRNC